MNADKPRMTARGNLKSGRDGHSHACVHISRQMSATKTFVGDASIQWRQRVSNIGGTTFPFPFSPPLPPSPSHLTPPLPPHLSP